eukprot:jgi/Ulvmu1/2361/UM013_0209.1
MDVSAQVSRSPVALLWDTCVDTRKLPRQESNAHTSAIQGLVGICCSWNHVFSIWRPQGAADVHLTVNQLECCIDNGSLQPLPTAAQLQDGPSHSEPVPNSSNNMCLSAGRDDFVTCSGHDIIVTLTDASQDVKGSNHSNQISQNQAAPPTRQYITQRYYAASQVTSSAAGGSHFAVSCQNGAVLCWGCNLQHQCSPDATPALGALIPVLPLQGLRMVAVAAGNNHTLALSDAGDVYAWGANECGQLGTGNRSGSCAASPQLIEQLGHHSPVVDVACGSRHSVAVDAEGKAFGWGWASAGQLGRWDIRSCRLQADTARCGVLVDNGQHGVLLSEQEGHQALLAAGAVLSWASLALQPRHREGKSALQSANAPACLGSSSAKAPPERGSQSQRGHGIVHASNRIDICDSNCLDVLDNKGNVSADHLHRQNAWHDPVHGLCMASPTEISLAPGTAGVVSCHAAWWHTVLMLSE